MMMNVTNIYACVNSKHEIIDSCLKRVHEIYLCFYQRITAFVMSSKQMNLAHTSDLVPTIMDWHGVALPSYKIFKKIISYTGKSLLQFPLPSNFLAIMETSALLPSTLIATSKQRVF